MLYVLCMCIFDNQLEIKHRLYHVFYFNMDQVSSTGRSLKARRQKAKAVAKHNELKVSHFSFLFAFSTRYQASLVSPC